MCGRAKRAWFVSLLSCLAGAACASSGAEPDAADRQCDIAVEVQAIVSGAQDTSHEAVVALVVQPLALGEAPVTVCTGTLIAPRIVLTAAHCIELLPPNREEIIVGRDVQATDVRRIRIVRSLRHPDWVSPFHDLALVLLADDAGLAPVALIDTTDAAWTPGNVLTLVGYGRDDDGRTGTRRSGHACVFETTPTHLRVRPQPALSCAGDSGGPALMDLDGAARLVGVASYGDPICIGAASYARLDIDLVGFVLPGLEQLEQQAFDGYDETTGGMKMVSPGKSR
jgi:secreted trypsin-like serine protease